MTRTMSRREQELNKFRKYLLSGKLKKTRTRELIFREIFSRSRPHLNALEIRHRLRARGHHVSLATIYRTLKLLVESGLVSAVDLGEDHSHYEPELSRPGHGHLICLACGRVKEFRHKDIRQVLSRIGAAKDFRLDKYSFQVFGYCRKCEQQ